LVGNGVKLRLWLKKQMNMLRGKRYYSELTDCCVPVLLSSADWPERNPQDDLPNGLVDIASKPLKTGQKVMRTACWHKFDFKIRVIVEESLDRHWYCCWMECSCGGVILEEMDRVARRWVRSAIFDFLNCIMHRIQLAYVG
jgi:hypothetical protein